MTKSGVLAVVCALCCLASSITVPAGPPVLRRQALQPVRAVRLHRSGPGPALRNVRLRNGPVKRIYVPMKVVPHPQRFNHPVPGYNQGPRPQVWKSMDTSYRPQHPQKFRPHVPHNLGSQIHGPPRKARHPKPKYSVKPNYPKYSKKTIPVSFDSYNAQPSYNVPSLVTDSYAGSTKSTGYKLSGTTYGKPNPLGSPEPPKKSVVLLKDEPATSYINVYQGDKATEDGNPTYGFTQSHTHNYEKKHKGSVHSETEPLVANHRPVYKHKSDTVSGSSSQSLEEDDRSQGSFQPPKQTYGFQPYEETRREGSAEGYGPTQPAQQQHYKKQPETILGPNYFEQGKS